MSPRPKDRYQSAEEMREAFQRSGELGEGNAEIASELSLSKGKVPSTFGSLPDSSRTFFRAVKVCSVTLVLLVCIIAGLKIYSNFQQLGEIPHGKYQGSFEDEALANKKVGLRVDQRGLYLTLGLESCTKGFVGRLTREIECEKAGMLFRLRLLEGDEILAEIEDTSAQQVFPVRFKKKSSQTIRK